MRLFVKNITELFTNQIYLLQKNFLGKPHTNKDVPTTGNSAGSL